MESLKTKIRQLILEQMSKREISFYGVNTGAVSFLLDNPGYFSKLISNHQSNNAQAIVEEWCEQNIGPKMGKGYSRLAFAMRGNNDLVFKVSYIGAEGDLTNQKEIENFTKHSFQNTFFPRVFASDPGGEWFVVEKLNLLTGEESEPVEEVMNRFDPYIRKNIKTLKSIESLLLLLLQGKEDANEMYNILVGLPKQASFNLYDGSNRIAYFYFDAALKLAWDKDIWKHEVVNSLQNLDIYDYFQGQHEAFLEKLCNTILRDPWMMRVADIIKSLNIDWGDIGPGNIGIDEQGNIKILDISIFDEQFSGSMFVRSSDSPISWG